MSEPSLATLAETINASHAVLIAIQARVEAQSAEIRQLQADVQAFREELIGLQFVPRFDYISDGVRRIRLQLEEYEKVQAELTYLPEALNEVFARLRESITKTGEPSAQVDTVEQSRE